MVARRAEPKHHRSNQHGDQERMVMVRSITIPRILKRWCNSHDILDIKGGNIQGKEEQCWVARNSRYNTKQEQVLCWRECNNVVDDNPNHRRSRMVFLITNSIDMLEELRMLTSTTQLSRDFRKM